MPPLSCTCLRMTANHAYALWFAGRGALNRALGGGGYRAFESEATHLEKWLAGLLMQKRGRGFLAGTPCWSARPPPGGVGVSWVHSGAFARHPATRKVDLLRLPRFARRASTVVLRKLVQPLEVNLEKPIRIFSSAKQSRVGFPNVLMCKPFKRNLGAKVWFCDVDAANFNISPTHWFKIQHFTFYLVFLTTESSWGFANGGQGLHGLNSGRRTTLYCTIVSALIYLFNYCPSGSCEIDAYLFLLQYVMYIGYK